MSKFCLDRFFMFILVWHHVTLKVSVLRGVNRQSHVGLVYLSVLSALTNTDNNNNNSDISNVP